jgi:hypothetical protein
LLVALIGACGGFALHPLGAEPPQPLPTPITVRAQPPVTIGGPAPAPCADAASQAGCATQKLQDVARAAQQAADPTLAVPNARSGDTTVGIGSLTGSSQRLGVDLRGRTTLPQRPVPPHPVSCLPRKP